MNKAKKQDMIKSLKFGLATMFFLYLFYALIICIIEFVRVVL